MRTYKFHSFALFTIVFSILSPTAVAADVPLSFTFQGSGYGHGVGMSQIGARGQALAGDTATTILQYYYKDVVVAPVRDDQLMRVNIGHLLTGFSLKTDTKLGQLQLFSGDIQENIDSVPEKILPAKVSLSFTLLGSAIFPSATYANGRVEALPSGKMWTIRWSGTRYVQSGADAVVLVKNGAATTKYRYGQIQVKLVKATSLGFRIEVTNTVRLHDEYLWGIGEVPSSWPLEAMRAQAIASRSFALSKVGKIKSSCDCDIYSASQDQSFVGYSKEIEPRYGQLWKAAVVSTSTDDVTGLAILYNSLPIAAYFFSSSGGQTESAVDVWGTAVPYAISVPDPWSRDPLLNSKYANWERPIAQALVAGAFGLPDVAAMEITNRRASGKVGTIVGISSTGKKVQLTGGTFSSRVKLPSGWFDFLGPQMSSAAHAPAPTPTPTPTPTLAPRPTPKPTIMRRL